MEAWVGYGLLFISLAVFCASLGFLYLLAQRFAKLSVGPGEVLEVVSRGGPNGTMPIPPSGWPLGPPVDTIAFKMHQAHQALSSAIPS